MPLAKLVSGN